MQKQLYRTVESLLERIDHSAGDEKMLTDILELLVHSPDSRDLGIISGRLYREEATAYRLFESIGEHGAAIAGKTVSKSYQVVQDIERRRLWIISPRSPGFDAEVEAQFTGQDAAAILVGRDPAYILSLGITDHLSEEDLLILLETIRAAVGLKLREQALASQMRQAREIQQSLVPPVLPTLAGYDLAAASTPAEDVGGDVYDIQEVEANVLGMLIADASGHGLPAALQARDVVIGMRMGQAEGEKITGTISRLNKVIHDTSLASRFISLFYGELEAGGNLAYVNGGHCPPLLITPKDEVFELKVCGPVLGPLPEATYTRGYLTLAPGEILVLFTDGVTERHDPRQGSDIDDIDEYGRDRLVQTVLAERHNTAAEITAAIMKSVRKFGNRSALADDMTVMVVKRLSAEHYFPAEDLTRVSVETRR